MLNENPIPPSEKVVKAVAEAIKGGHRYATAEKIEHQNRQEALWSGTG